MAHSTPPLTPTHPAGPGPMPAPELCLERARALVLPEDGRPVLLAISGGSDSMALLGAAAAGLARAEVVHVQHGLRASADDDAALVAAQARRHALPFHLAHAPPTADDPSRTETAARRRRYRALVEVARRCGASRVLTAHHLDDDLETLLLHALRGHRGLRATCGVPSVRPLAPAHSARGELLVVRPFALGPTPPGREALGRWRREHQLPCAEDASNADRRVARNAVRAWLAAPEQDAARGQLVELRRASRLRLQATVTRAAELLARHLHAEGLGARLDRAVLDELDGPTATVSEAAPVSASACASDGDTGLALELLRLLGLALARPRRCDPHRALLSAWLGLGRRGRGQLALPATPAPLHWQASRAGWHLPHEALGPGDPAARSLAAVLRTSLYL